LANAVGAQEERAALGTVHGIVVDSIGAPVRAAEVWLSRWSSEERLETTTTSNGGNFTLRSVPLDESLLVWATAPGLTRERTIVRVAPAARSATERIRLWEAGTLRGRVVDAQGAPIADAQVGAAFESARSRGFEPAGQAITDATGALELSKIPLGDIVVRAIAPGRLLGQAELYLRDEADVQLTLAEGTGVRISVRVEGVGPDVAKRLAVRVLPYGPRSHQILPSRLVAGSLDDRGEWHARGLPSLEYKVSVHGQDLSLSPGSAEFKPGAGDAHHHATFKLLTRDAILLRGRIVCPDGRPLASATMQCRDDNARRAAAQTGPDGRFELRGPFEVGTACTFELVDVPFVLSVPPQEQKDPFGLEFFPSIRSVIRTDQEYALQATPAAEVRGRLTAKDGAPLRFHPVTLAQENPSRMPRWMTCARTTTDRTGSFVFSRLRPSPHDCRVETSGPDASGQSEPFQLRPEQPLTDIVVACEAASAVSGVVLDGAGQPIPGARVWLRDYDASTGRQTSGSVFEVRTDRQGRFRHVGVEPGGHRLEVRVIGQAASALAEGDDLFEVRPGESLERRLRLQ
jgi:protocatechuate 3,4-dioxygenase beta subunit